MNKPKILKRKQVCLKGSLTSRDEWLVESWVARWKGPRAKREPGSLEHISVVSTFKRDLPARLCSDSNLTVLCGGWPSVLSQGLQKLDRRWTPVGTDPPLRWLLSITSSSCRSAAARKCESGGRKNPSYLSEPGASSCQIGLWRVPKCLHEPRRQGEKWHLSKQQTFAPVSAELTNTNLTEVWTFYSYYSNLKFTPLIKKTSGGTC